MISTIYMSACDFNQKNSMENILLHHNCYRMENWNTLPNSLRMNISRLYLKSIFRILFVTLLFTCVIFIYRGKSPITDPLSYLSKYKS